MTLSLVSNVIRPLVTNMLMSAAKARQGIANKKDEE